MDHRPLEDWEYPEPDDPDHDNDDDGASETRPCPSCGTDVYEDAEQCPACGEYVVFSGSALSHWPWWFVALGLIGMAAAVFALSGGW